MDRSRCVRPALQAGAECAGYSDAAEEQLQLAMGRQRAAAPHATSSCIRETCRGDLTSCAGRLPDDTIDGMSGAHAEQHSPRRSVSRQRRRGCKPAQLAATGTQRTLAASAPSAAATSNAVVCCQRQSQRRAGAVCGDRHTLAPATPAAASVYCQRTIAEAYVRPAPKPASASVAPGRMRPSRTASSSASGMLAALVLP